MSLIHDIKRLKKQILGSFLKARLTFLNRSVDIGSDFYGLSGCRCSRGKNIKIGDRFYMGHNCFLSADLIIGDDVMFASCVTLVGGDHDISDPSINLNASGRDVDVKPIVIGSNVWIGHGVIILAGVNIGKNSIVGAGSIVTKDVPENMIYAGNPAKQIKSR